MTYLRRLMLTIVGVTVVVSNASPASASCVTDEDCDAGYVCTSYEREAPSCVTMDPDCADGDDECWALAKERMAECETFETETVSYCEPAPCETDADCGEGMVCHEEIEEWCSGSAMEECDGDECKIIEQEVECGQDVYRSCVHSYALPCQESADCGEGFNCVPREICTCGSTGSTGGGDIPDISPDMVDLPATAPDEGATEPGTNPVAERPAPADVEDVEDVEYVEPECSCEPTGEGYCELQDLACETDADCPASMICDVAEAVSTCGVSPDGEEICTEVESVSECRPENWYGVRDSVTTGDGDYAGEGEETNNVSENHGAPGDDGALAPSPDNGTPQTESGPAIGSDDGDADEDANADSSAEGQVDSPEVEGSEQPAAEEGQTGEADAPEADADDENATKETNNDSGCSVAAPASGSPSGAGLLGLLGLLMIAIRRRR